MNKRLLIGLSLFLAPIFNNTAYASINLDLRTDYRDLSYNQDAGKQNLSTFAVKGARLDMQGKIADDYTFRLRFGLNKDYGTASNNESSLQKSVEFAYLTQKFSDTLSLTAGRYGSEVGGFEGAQTSLDHYLLSAGYTGSGITYLSGASATNKTATQSYLYVTGAKVTTNFGDQSVSLMVANPIGNADTAQSRFLTGLVYKTSFMEKALKFIASYHSAGLTSSAKEDGVKLAALGVNYTFGDNMLGLDYLMNTYAHGTTTAVTDSSSTTAMSYTYKGLESITPIAKYTMTQDKPDTASSMVTVSGMSLALEYKPLADAPVRYHVAYTSTAETSEASGQSQTPTQQEVVVGMRLAADFLK